MAKSTYISENLTTDQLGLLKYLDDHEVLYFRLTELLRALPSALAQNANELVENLNQKGLLERMERGVYARPNFTNVNALATFISKNSCIAYWSALHHHGLTERFPNTVFVKTTQRKRDTSILGTPIKFVTVKESKLLGTLKEGYGDDSFLVTDVEMTLVDCFDQPRYAGGFQELVAAFANAQLDGTKLIDYCTAFQNIALTKRLGYLASLFHAEELGGFIAFAKAKVNKKYNLIDAGGTEAGAFINEWKLRLNVPEDELLRMAETDY
jgi:predicted transcriptional regulator of viral defense system